MSWISVLKASELATGQARAVEVAGQRIILLRLSSDTACAVEHSCSQDEEPFGEAPVPPPASPLEVFPARITTDGWIEVDPEGSP